jgi:hypothetical protein
MSAEGKERKVYARAMEAEEAKFDLLLAAKEYFGG